VAASQNLCCAGQGGSTPQLRADQGQVVDMLAAENSKLDARLKNHLPWMLVDRV